MRSLNGRRKEQGGRLQHHACFRLSKERPHGTPAYSTEYRRMVSMATHGKEALGARTQSGTINLSLTYVRGFPGGSEVKASAWNVGDPGSILGLGRSPGEENCNPHQYSCLENPMEGGAL